MKKMIPMIVLLLLVTSMPTVAGVNLKNGNFYITYTDIVVPGAGETLEITRTYNSKSTDDGWFGFGWGSDYETFLVVAADGSVVVHENGAGALTRFTPRKKIDPQNAVQKIIKAVKKDKPGITPKALASLGEKLKSDAELRQVYARRYNVSTSLADGTTLYSNERGLQKLKKLKKGFVRTYADGKNEFFDEEGKLTKITYKGNYFVMLSYNSAGKVESIKDSKGKQLFLKWYPGKDGKVQHAWSVGDKKVEYKYKNNDLIFVKDVGGNEYSYAYDKNHNMEEVKYKDGRKMTMTYEPNTFFVSSVTDKNNQKTSYKYESNPKNPYNHYWTLVTKNGLNGKPVTNRYEYEIRTKPDGEKYTYRVLTVINNIRTETINSECCGLPIKITRGNITTNFEYNKDGLLTKKTSTTGERVELDYHPKFKKITRVKNNEGVTEFKYNNKSELSYAKNSKGDEIKLYYDIDGRIKTMSARNKKLKQKKAHTLKFKYNTLGKPVEITMVNVGKINVSYDNYGEIKKVDSKKGSKMAIQVTSAFQNLLNIVKPAGVSLSL